MLKEEGMFKYKTKNGEILESPIIDIREMGRLIELTVAQSGGYAWYLHNIETGQWYVRVDNPQEPYEPSYEEFDDKALGFYFTKRWCRDESN